MNSIFQLTGEADSSADFDRSLEAIVDRINRQQGRRKRVAEALAGLRGANVDCGGTVEPFSVKEVRMDPLTSLSVAGIDGGLLEQQLHGLDLILARAIAAVFHYRDAALEGAEYFPNEFPSPKLIDVSESLDSWEFQLLAGMERQLAEMELAGDVAELGGVGVIILDGSIVPQYVERSPQRQLLLERYQSLMQAYGRLYQACARSGILLVGAVKDSRGARFVDILKGQVLPAVGDIGLGKEELEVLDKSRDTVLLDHLLREGERTPAFTYAENPASYVLRDLGAWAAKIFAFYIKTVPLDRPLRVEFLGGDGEPGDVAERIASLIYALSSHHEAFGLPSVIIEADACARLAEDDLVMVRDSISDRLEPSSLLDLRRSRRPF